jgi:hypothetical protein
MRTELNRMIYHPVEEAHMKRYMLIPVLCIVSVLLFPGCDEEKDQGFLKLLPLVSMMNANSASFHATTENNIEPDPQTVEKDLSMTSSAGFILTGDDYVGVFTDGVEIFTISLPNTVTASSTYTESSMDDFMAMYSVEIDSLPIDLLDTDGYGGFTFQVTSLTDRRITATFSGILFFGTYETMYAISSLSGGTLSASIGE